MSFFSGQTASRAPRRILGFHPQTSISGKVLAVLGGTRRIGGNVIWAGNFKSSPVKGTGKGSGKTGGGGKGGGGDLTYRMAAMIELCRGQLGKIGRVWNDRTEYRNMGGTKYRAVSGTLTNSALPDLNFELITGFKGQPIWGYIQTNNSDEALPYSEVAMVVSPNIDLGTSALLPNFNWEVTGIQANYNNGLDCDPVNWSYVLMTDPDWGAGLQATDVGDYTLASNYAIANGLFCSPLLDTQQKAAVWLEEYATIGNFAFVCSEGLIKMVSYGDTNATGNGASFTANVTPIYDLGDDDFLGDKEAPIKLSLPAISDSSNRVSVEWLNRANGYNEEPVYEDDQASIDQFGIRPLSVISLHSITEHPVAAKVCHLILKKAAYQRLEASFTLGAQYCLLEPMDLVTLTDLYTGLNKRPFRIMKVEETETGEFNMTAEEFIFGLAAPALHQKQTVSGYGPGFFAQPGLVFPPMFFEAPPQLTQNVGFELFIGICGGPNWGGCGVWHSIDNVSYENVGRFTGPSTMGFLTAPLPGTAPPDPDLVNTLSVDLTESFGVLNSVTQAAADNHQTLLVIDGELLSYETAVLTGVNKYNVTYLRRGVYSSALGDHGTATQFLSITDPVFTFIFNSPDVGKLHYFKFTSFNRLGEQEEPLANSIAYPHTILSSGSGTISGVYGTPVPVANVMPVSAYALDDDR